MSMRIIIDNPQEFTDKLYSYHLNEKTRLANTRRRHAADQKSEIERLEQIAVAFANGLWLRSEIDAVANAYFL